MSLLHSLEALLGRLLSLLRIVGVVNGGLETASDVVGVLVTLGLPSLLEVARVENLYNQSYEEGDFGHEGFTSRLCCLDSSEVLGLLMLALWPPAI